LILLALVAVMALPAYAARRVTVEQLEQTLTAAFDAHTADAEMARQIGALELSERLTDAALNRLTVQHSQPPRGPGPATASRPIGHP
jgi:type II secretory pathway pseudopilin PulG